LAFTCGWRCQSILNRLTNRPHRPSVTSQIAFSGVADCGQ
jgi:hypothetical protein